MKKDILRLLVRISKGGTVNKNEMAEALRLTNYDVALPQIWVDQVRNLGIDTSFYVWDYTDNTAFGKPLNLLESMYFKATF